MKKLSNIMLASISAPPKNAPESIQVGRYLRYLVKSYNVTLVTTPTDNGWRRHDSSLMPDYSVSQTIMVDFPLRNILLKILRKVNNSFAKMPDGDFWFHHMHKFVVNRVHNKPSIIYSRSTPYSSAILAHKLKQVYRVPWVLHLSDPWADNPFLKYDKKAYAYQQHNEAACFASADRVALTSGMLVDYYLKKYPAYSNKFFLSNNVYDDCTTFEPACSRNDGPLTLVCTGSFYGERNPLPLLKAIRILKERKPESFTKVKFVFAGNMDDVSKATISSYSFENVRFLGRVSYAEASRLQNSAHVLVSIDADQAGDIYKVFLPSKILDYISRRRRILALTPLGSMTDRMMQKGYGCAFAHSETEKIAEHIVHLVKKFESGDVGFFETPPPLEEFSPRYNVDKLIELFDSLTSNSSTMRCRD